MLREILKGEERVFLYFILSLGHVFPLLMVARFGQWRDCRGLELHRTHRDRGNREREREGGKEQATHLLFTHTHSTPVVHIRWWVCTFHEDERRGMRERCFFSVQPTNCSNHLTLGITHFANSLHTHTPSCSISNTF